MPGTADVRSDKYTCIDCPAQILVGIKHVCIAHRAHPGPAGQQQALQACQGHQALVRRRALQVHGLIIVTIHKGVFVGVDHAGHQGSVAQFNDFGSGWNNRAAANCHDVIVLDQHHPVGQCRFIPASDQPIGGNRQSGLSACAEAHDHKSRNY